MEITFAGLHVLKKTSGLNKQFDLNEFSNFVSSNYREFLYESLIGNYVGQRNWFNLDDFMNYKSSNYRRSIVNDTVMMTSEGWKNSQLFHLVKITENYSTSVTQYLVTSAII